MSNYATANMGDSRILISVLKAAFCNIDAVATGVEIGVQRGITSALLLREFPKLRLKMVDSWKGDLPPDHPYRVSGDGCAKLTQEQQNENFSAATAATDFAADRRTILRMSSEWAAEISIMQEQSSFVFIDGDHTYEAVKKDIAAWWPIVMNRGGLLSGHDLDHPRDRRGVWGVRRAVEEFIERENERRSIESVGRIKERNRLFLQSSGSVWWIVKS